MHEQLYRTVGMATQFNVLASHVDCFILSQNLESLIYKWICTFTGNRVTDFPLWTSLSTHITSLVPRPLPESGSGLGSRLSYDYSLRKAYNAQQRFNSCYTGDLLSQLSSLTKCNGYKSVSSCLLKIYNTCLQFYMLCLQFSLLYANTLVAGS